MKKYGYVYKVTNVLNNKIYIGSRTCGQNPNLDYKYLGSGYKQIEAINKYGKENFIKEILFISDSINRKDLFKIEDEFVNKFKSNNPDIGYNCLCTSGGGYVSKEHYANLPICQKGKILSKEHIKAIIEGKRRNGTLKHREESKIKTRNTFLKTLENNPKLREKFSHPKDKNPFYGKKHTEENRRLIAKIRSKGRILQIDIKSLSILKIWDSNEQILRDRTIIGRGSIFNIVKRKIKKRIFNNCYWVFEKEIPEIEVVNLKITENTCQNIII